MNGPKKFMIAIFSSMFVLFLIWGVIFYSQHVEIFRQPPGVQNVLLREWHLDLRATFGHFQTIFKQNIGDELLKTLKSFKTTTERFNNSGFNVVNNIISAFNGGRYASYSGGFSQILTAINGLINPIYGLVNSVVVLAYISIIGMQLLGVVVNVLWGFYEFIFNPVFIHVESQGTLQFISMFI